MRKRNGLWAWILLPAIGTVTFLGDAWGTATISSRLDQRFALSGSAVFAEPITITQTSAADGTDDIDSSTDVRITIPAAFAMTWDTSITAIVVVGGASGNVSTTLGSYEDASKTALVDITTSFAQNDSVTIYGLKFTSITAVETQDNLDMELDNDGSVDSTDDKILTTFGAKIESDSAQIQPTTASDPAINKITITDGATAEITDANNIRLVIPSTVDMTWETSDTTATITGGASSKVSTTVSFPSSKVMIVDVTSDFSASDVIEITDLKFNSPSSAGVMGRIRMILDGSNSGSAADVDRRTTGVTGPTIAMSSKTVDANDTTINKITITDVTPDIDTTNELRIAIPVEVGLKWDSSPGPTITITGSGVLASATPAIEDSGAGDRVLRWDVTTAFAAGDVIAIDGLKVDLDGASSVTFKDLYLLVTGAGQVDAATNSGSSGAGGGGAASGGGGGGGGDFVAATRDAGLGTILAAFALILAVWIGGIVLVRLRRA